MDDLLINLSGALARMKRPYKVENSSFGSMAALSEVDASIFG
jgi:hypothetical protein